MCRILQNIWQQYILIAVNVESPAYMKVQLHQMDFQIPGYWPVQLFPLCCLFFFFQRICVLHLSLICFDFPLYFRMVQHTAPQNFQLWRIMRYIHGIRVMMMMETKLVLMALYFTAVPIRILPPSHNSTLFRKVVSFQKHTCVHNFSIFPCTNLN